MRAVVIGGSGQIGGWLLAHLADRGHEALGTYASVPMPGLYPLDAADPDAASWVRNQRPEVVFYPAGFTWVDGCEKDPAKARAANLEQPLAIARATADAGARFIYFSTDYIFDGHHGPYTEAATPNPLSAYGRVKLEAEQVLAEELDDLVLIARTCWVYGPEKQGKNFAYQVLKNLRAGQPVVCPSDQSANPSYAPDVALSAILCAENGLSGIIHLAGPQVMDRGSFASAIAKTFGLDETKIQAKPTSELPQGAPRPLAGGLTSERLGTFQPDLMRSPEQALLDFREKVGVGQPWANPLV